MKKTARWIGITLQAAILGTLLFFAVGKLVALETGARIFRYQGF